MRSILGRVVDAVLVHGLSMLEHIVSMPPRLGMPLPGAAPRSADPVILVSGFANSASPGWDQWRQSLIADGFDVYVVDLSTHGLGDMYSAAREVADFIAAVKRKTGRNKVDLVGFSEGGLLARMAVAELGQAGNVDRVIAVATPEGGLSAKAAARLIGLIPIIGVATPESISQMLVGSKLITDLNAADDALRHGNVVRYASIHSRSFDGATSPNSAHLPGALDVTVNFRAGDHRFRLFGFGGPNHFDMFHYSSPAFEAARALLLDTQPAGMHNAATGGLSVQ